MSRSFWRSVDKVLDFEGGFADHDDDPGGKTKFGITEAVLEEHFDSIEDNIGFEIEDLDIKTAKQIYKVEYWDKSNLNDIASLNEDVAFKVFDASVNIGVNKAVSFLQISLNVLNIKEELYSDLEVDGILGEKTVSAFRKYWEFRGKNGIEILLKALNSLQGEYYISIARNNEKLESFVYGWLNKRIN